MAKKTTKTAKTTESTYKITKNTLKSSYLDKIEEKAQANQSKVSLILGGLIILVIGLLIFNYFNKGKSSLGPAQQAQQQEKQDVSKDNLPGSYTVKEEDTLFTIAEKYYDNGSRFSEIAKANNISDPNQIEAGLVLQIPKPESQLAKASTTPEPTSTPEASPQEDKQLAEKAEKTSEESMGTGTGGGDSTIWGSKIEGNTYTVSEGDWLSTIAGRAYGDIYVFEKIAQANNIADPDHIEPGMVLTIPR